MIINRIRVRRFRAIEDGRIIEFSPGLNIIKGSDNEAGKSSLRMAITKALFQDPSTSREDIIGLTSWGADEPWEIELDFESDSGSFRLIKSLKARTSQLVDAGSSRVIANNKSAIAAKVAEFTGCPSEVFFESTACIGQEELIRIVPRGASPHEQQRTLGTVGQRLRASLGSAEAADVRSILAKLLSKTTRKDARGPYYHLQQINERMASVRGQEADLKTRVKSVMENRRRLNAVKDQLAQIDSELPLAEALMKKSRRILDLEAEIEAGKRQYVNCERARELTTELSRLDEGLREFAALMHAEDQRRQVSAAMTESERLKTQQSHLDADMETILDQRPRSWSLLAGAFLLVAGVILTPLVQPYLGVPAAVMGILLLAYGIDRRLTWHRKIRLNQSNGLKLEGLARKNDQVLRSALAQFGFRDYEEYVRQITRYDRQAEKRNEVALRLSGLIGDRDWTAFEEENRDLDLQISAKQKELKELLSFKMDPLRLQELETRVGQLRTQRAELDDQRARQEGALEAADIDTDRLAAVGEEIRWLEHETAFWERKTRVYNIARQALEEAYTQTLSRAATVLDRELGRYVSTITDGRYGRVEIDEKDLSISTYSVESGERVSVRDLSRATQDQFYISARFALVRLVTEGKRPPLLLDDPFVNFHQKRVARIMGLLQELARENQILLFTCSDSYDVYGNVISLD